MRRIFGTQSATLFRLSYNFPCVFAFLVQLPLYADSLLQPHYGVLCSAHVTWRITKDFDYMRGFRFGSDRSELVCSTYNTHIWKVGVRFIISRFPRTTLPSRKFHAFQFLIAAYAKTNKNIFHTFGFVTFWFVKWYFNCVRWSPHQNSL